MHLMHESMQEQLQPRFLTLHNGPQHSVISLLEPLFGNQLATNPLKYSPSFHFQSYAPREQQAGLRIGGKFRISCMDPV